MPAPADHHLTWTLLTRKSNVEVNYLTMCKHVGPKKIQELLKNSMYFNNLLTINMTYILMKYAQMMG